MNRNGLSWQIDKKDNQTLVVFDGEVDERSEFDPMTGALSGEVIFDLAKINRLNSEGIRRWINFIRSLNQVSRLVFERCSIPVVTQLNIVGGFQGAAEIRSFYAPYFCEATGEDEQRLLAPADIPDPLDPPVFPCDGGTLELDDLPERYFAFLVKRT